MFHCLSVNFENKREYFEGKRANLEDMNNYILQHSVDKSSGCSKPLTFIPSRFHALEQATHDVKTKLPNELGIYDMSGNVLEWVNDWFGDYPSGKQTDPTGPSSGRYKVLRGGSWFNPSAFCRVSFRNYMEPDRKNFMFGLRLAL